MTQPFALIVEDDRTIADIFSRVLKAGDYETTVIDDGQAALDALAEMTPHVVVLDLNLPTVSGLHILNHMRKDARLEKTWVILATANAIQAASIDDDSDNYLFKLLKPISVEQLLRLVSVLKASLEDLETDAEATAAEAAKTDVASKSEAETETAEAEAVVEAAEIEDDDRDGPPLS